MLNGVDVHVSFQSGLNIELLAQQGYAFCVVKATEGSGGYTAPAAFNDWIRRARAAGMVPGAYHWLNNTNPTTQADHFLRRLDQVGGTDGMLLQIDCEDTTSPASAATLERFVASLRARIGPHPLQLYSGAWWYGPHLGNYRAADLGLNLWDSRYVQAGHGSWQNLAPLVPGSWWTARYGGWAHPTILQYTSKGDAGGLSANVDLNLFDGTTDQLRRLAGASGDDMTPEEHNWLMGCYFEGRPWAGGALTVAQRAEAAVGVLAKTVTAIAEKVDVDPGELAAITQAAQLGAAAALSTVVPEIVAAVNQALADAGHDVDAAVVEAAVRKVFADAATPDQPPT